MGKRIAALMIAMTDAEWRMDEFLRRQRASNDALRLRSRALLAETFAVFRNRDGRRKP